MSRKRLCWSIWRARLRPASVSVNTFDSSETPRGVIAGGFFWTSAIWGICRVSPRYCASVMGQLALLRRMAYSLPIRCWPLLERWLGGMRQGVKTGSADGGMCRICDRAMHMYKLYWSS